MICRLELQIFLAIAACNVSNAKMQYGWQRLFLIDFLRHYNLKQLIN